MTVHPQACLCTVCTLVPRIAALTDEQRRDVNAQLIALGTRFVADSGQVDGYRELGQKCAALEAQRDAAVLAERERVLRQVEGLILDERDAIEGQWPKIEHAISGACDRIAARLRLIREAK